MLSSTQSTSNVYKLVVIGNGGVGKSTMIEALKNHLMHRSRPVSQKSLRTRYMNFVSIPVSDAHFVLQVWDCMGQRFNMEHPIDHIASTIFNQSSIVLLVFAQNDLDSFLDLWDRWFPLIKDYLPSSAELILVGNKGDLDPLISEAACQSVIRDLAPSLTQAFQQYFLVSAYANTQIPALGQYIISCLQPPELSAFSSKNSDPITQI